MTWAIGSLRSHKQVNLDHLAYNEEFSRLEPLADGAVKWPSTEKFIEKFLEEGDWTVD